MLAKSKLNIVEVLISEALIDSNISHDEFVFCLKSRKNAKVVKTKNERIMLLSKCAVCNSRKSEFTKEREARGLLSS